MTTQGERLKDIRIALKLNQQQLAERLGIKGQSISSAEKDISKLSNDNLSKLHKDLNVNLNWLFSGNGNMFIISDKKAGSEFDKIMESEGCYFDENGFLRKK